MQQRNKASLPNLFFAASKRLESPTRYREFQEIQATLLLDYLDTQGVQLSGMTVLDLGCGHGGYSHVFESQGAKVMSSDLVIERATSGATASLACAIQADATRLPLADASFDFVFCASLIEHVADSQALINEIERVMKPGAECYLSFPPFYTPIGGHQFKPFHLLGERVALAAYRRMNKNDEVASTGFNDAFGEWGLFRRTIRGTRKQIEIAGLEVIDQSTRYLPLNVSKLPLVSEFVTWHVQFLLRKPA